MGVRRPRPASCSWLTRCSRPTARGTGRWTRIVRAARSRRSTSSSSATGSRRRAGTRRARRRDCPTDVVARTREKYVEAYETPDRPGIPVEMTSDRRCHAPIPDRRRVARAGPDRDRRRVSVGRRARHGARSTASSSAARGATAAASGRSWRPTGSSSNRASITA